MPDRALELFRDACGLASPLTLEVRDPVRASRGSVAHHVQQPYALIGRDEQADVVLQDAQVSRRHAYVQAIGGQVLCIDLNSRTKLHWEGEPGQRDRGWLAPGQDLGIGPYALHWAGQSRPTKPDSTSASSFSPLETPDPELGSLPGAALVLPQEDNSQQSLWRLSTRITLLGRSEACHLVLGHESVSRLHASLISTPSGVWIVDLLAREGVCVNGLSVRWAWLDDGDAVRIGRFTFIVRYEAKPSGISRVVVPVAAGASHGPPRPTSSRAHLPSPDPRTGLAVRPRKDPRAFLPTAIPAQALSPVIMQPSSPAEWELSAAVPPQQLALWQQQMRMMETFHDDMMLMVQMFMAMHREHLGAVNDELDKVRELSQELGRLQGKLTEPAATPQNARPQNGATAGQDHGTSANGSLVPKLHPPASTTAASPPPVASIRSDRSSPTTPAGNATAANGSERSSSKEPSQARPSLGDQSKFHVDITRRITELQRERQGYWQRILTAINKPSN